MLSVIVSFCIIVLVPCCCDDTDFTTQWLNGVFFISCFASELCTQLRKLFVPFLCQLLSFLFIFTLLLPVNVSHTFSYSLLYSVFCPCPFLSIFIPPFCLYLFLSPLIHPHLSFPNDHTNRVLQLWHLTHVPLWRSLFNLCPTRDLSHGTAVSLIRTISPALQLLCFSFPLLSSLVSALPFPSFPLWLCKGAGGSRKKPCRVK